MEEITELKRSLSLPLITFYGLGSIIGAGIYVLVGQVAGVAGLYTPFAFILASLIAAFTAFSYAELSSRYPYSAGEAKYVLEGLRCNWLSIIAGWLVVTMGIFSSATLANGFVGYFHIFYKTPDWIIITSLIITLCIIAVWGIRASAIIAAIITLIEIGGLIFVLIVAGHNFSSLPQHWHKFTPTLNITTWSGIIMGSYIAFFAFIGFEDMVNVAEEVKNVRRNLPIAIFIAVIVSTILYVSVALICVLSLPLYSLAHSSAPLALIVEKNNFSPFLISLISLIAIINGTLIQLIMASRVIYGMSKQSGTPHALGIVNRKTQTPIRATVFVTGIILIFALWLPIETLAKTTSSFTLSMFSLVNLSLILIKLKKPRQEGAACYPIWMPVIGLLLCCALLIANGMIMLVG